MTSGVTGLAASMRRDDDGSAADASTGAFPCDVTTHAARTCGAGVPALMRRVDEGSCPSFFAAFTAVSLLASPAFTFCGFAAEILRVVDCSSGGGTLSLSIDEIASESMTSVASVVISSGMALVRSVSYSGLGVRGVLGGGTLDSDVTDDVAACLRTNFAKRTSTELLGSLGVARHCTEKPRDALLQVSLVAPLLAPVASVCDARLRKNASNVCCVASLPDDVTDVVDLRSGSELRA